MTSANCETSIALLKERKQIFMDAVGKKKKPKRIPMLSNVWSWKVLDAGYKLSEAFTSYDIMFKAVCTHQERYGWDTYMDIGTRNPRRVTDALGKQLYLIDDETGYMNYIDKSVMEYKDYPKILNEGLYNFYFEDGIVSKFEYKTHEQALKCLGKAAREYVEYSNFGKKMNNELIHTYGVPAIAVGKPILPMEMLFCALRGIKGFSTDMRRDPGLIKAALEIINQGTYEQYTDMLNSFVDNDTCIFPVRITSLAHTVMNPKQYEDIYWPYYKKYIEHLSNKGYGAFLFTEGSMAHIVDFMREIPSGKFALLLEMDDVFEMKEKLPNLTIVGGFPRTLLATGTVDECIDYVKKLEDEMACDGSYIFSFSKMISYPKDAKSENMKAITQYLSK